MDNNRMSTADMLQYCNEALAWEDFGPIDIFFFESVKRILLGQCSAFEDPEDQIDDLMGIERPVSDAELEPDYPKYADIFYGEEGDEEIPDYSHLEEDEAFAAEIFGDGFFEEEDEEEGEYESEDAAEQEAPSEEDTSQEAEAAESSDEEEDEKEAHQSGEGSFTVNI